jgi:hypothetical protein
MTMDDFVTEMCVVLTADAVKREIDGIELDVGVVSRMAAYYVDDEDNVDKHWQDLRSGAKDAEIVHMYDFLLYDDAVRTV